MAMLHKWATGSHGKDNAKDDSESNAVMQASGDFANELPATEPSEAGGTVGAAQTPYTLIKAKQYSAAGRQNQGKSVAGNVTAKKILRGWYNYYHMYRWRKTLKYRNEVGVEHAAPNTNLYDA